LHVYFDDGDDEWLPSEGVCENDLTVGSRVFARFQRGPGYFPGRIVRREGERIMIAYDDGQQEDTSIRWVRVRRGPIAMPWKVGQRVLAQWLHEPFFYPGSVQAVSEDLVDIQYDDGDRACVPPEVVLPLRLKVGDHVYVRRETARTYTPALIERCDGERLFLRFEDGKKNWAAVKYIRVLPAELAHLSG
jgi:hypothetical protein